MYLLQCLNIRFNTLSFTINTIIPYPPKVPPGVQQLQERLRSFTLERNKLLEVPGWLGAFKTLRTLNLDNNVCSDLPIELSEIKKLETLSMANNRLARFPTCLYNMRFLKTLNLASNQVCARVYPRERVCNREQGRESYAFDENV